MNTESKILLDIHKEEFENYKKYIDSNNWFDDVFFNTKKWCLLLVFCTAYILVEFIVYMYSLFIFCLSLN